MSATRWISVLAAAILVCAFAVPSVAATPAPMLAPAAAGVPGTPPKVSVTPGNKSATVRWTAPTSPRGLPITHYVITPVVDRSALPARTVGAGSSAIIKGLSNGQSYSFRVAAMNAVGIGAARASVAVTAGAPVAPAVISVVAGKRSAVVRWKPPATSNGSSVTGYFVTPYRSGIPLARQGFAARASSGTLSNLTGGTIYRFTVSARNGFGTSLPSVLSAPVAVACVGVAMTHGQSDISSRPGGTTFCLSGTHNWTLTPKSGDALVGPATLNGAGVTRYAVVARAPNVSLVSLTIEHYNNGRGSQDGAIHVDDTAGAKQAVAGWHLTNLNVEFNSASGSGSGNGWFFVGGRYHDNGQEGIGGSMGNNVTVNYVQVDHNNFVNTSYTHRNWACDDEAGGIKWVGNHMTVENSSIHNNACKGLWVDEGARGAVIENNHVFDNWDEGIFVEISSGALVAGNTVTGNGFHDINGNGHDCVWLWGGGITLSTSDHVTVARNTVTGNCNGITAIEQTRPGASPGQLEDVSVTDNTIAGSGRTGASADNGANLATRSIVFAGNRIGGSMGFCNLACST